MTSKPKKAAAGTPRLYDRIRNILESARASVARTVNATQVMANWLIGLEYCRSFHRFYPLLFGSVNSNAVRSKSEGASASMSERIANAARAELPRSRLSDANSETMRRNLAAAPEIQHAVREASWCLDG